MENNNANTNVQGMENVERIETKPDGTTIVYVKETAKAESEKTEKKEEKKGIDLKEAAIKVGKCVGLVGIGAVGMKLIDHFFGGDSDDDED